jgi:hypothetical protein
MVAWQLEMGDMAEALGAVERARARSLADAMLQAGADLSSGRSAIEREQLAHRESELKQQVASLEKQLEVAADKPAERQPLETALGEARKQLYQHYCDARSSSPVYRNLLSVGGTPPQLSQIRRQLLADRSLMLVLCQSLIFG